jgi:very-short-patch-repair endonuclease
VGVMNRKVADHMKVSSRQTSLARAMRRAMTEPERKLWKALRWRLAIDATHFRRQVPIGPYITDFCSHGAKLIIEVDGNQHGDDAMIVRDAVRTASLCAQGYRVLRFSNHDVMTSIDVVLDTIVAALEPTPTPNPPTRGRGTHRALGADRSARRYTLHARGARAAGAAERPRVFRGVIHPDTIEPDDLSTSPALTHEQRTLFSPHPPFPEPCSEGRRPVAEGRPGTSAICSPKASLWVKQYRKALRSFLR